MALRAYRVAYDGRPYHGFQRQPDVPTVEGTILDALAALGVADGVPEGYAAAGRTDAGVSARAQTVAFEAPAWLDPAALNAELPADVRAWASADAPAGFHATHDAVERRYVYFLHAPTADDARARRALSALSGEHDFHNLTPDERGTVRTLSTDLRREDAFLVVELTAGGFARQLVRRAVSVVANVARGEAGIDRVERLLAAEPVDGPAGIAPAPAYPLVLADVRYGLSFDVDERAADSAREVFGARRVEHATLARVAAALTP
jgi:tRNA pseudouridine38-40 synthase